MSTSSFFGFLPLGVLMIRWISPFLIMSTTCGLPSETLLTKVVSIPLLARIFPGTLRRVYLETEVGELLRDEDDVPLVLVLHAQKDIAVEGQVLAGAELRLPEGGAEIEVDAHHLAGRFHLRSQDRIDAEELVEGEDRFLHRDVLDLYLFR